MKKTVMTKEMVLKWKAGYEAVNALTLAEQKAKTADQRLAELAQLHQLAKDMGWLEQMDEDVEIARKNWCTLKERYLADSRNTPSSDSSP